MPKEFFVVPITHVDLAWKRGEAEMSEMMEIVVIRLLDCLENDPDFKYHLEQAAHYRALQQRRPDLIERLKPFLQNGRLEMVGAMASTLENNLPNGECFVRNQQMGLDWVQKTWGVEVKTGWLIDTFGINAQVPQLLRGFGFTQLMANRFGGTHTRDLFRARGLDGSEIPVAGWGTYSAAMKRENLSERFCANWDDIDIIFAQADKLSGPGPYLVIPYTENEMLVSRRAQQLTAQRQRERGGESWKNATPREYFEAVEQSGRVLSAVSADLNPEFTGCFSLRQPIRLRNRRVENLLLEAEKWAALTKIDANCLEEAWWQLHFVQFHDVFTGSHPTAVFRRVMALLDEIEAAANSVLQRAFTRFAPEKSENSLSFSLFNGLPWARREITTLPLPGGFEGVARLQNASGEALPFEVRDGQLHLCAAVPALGSASFSLSPGPATSASAKPEKWRQVEVATLENATIRLDFDTINGLAQLIWKPNGQILLQNAGNWLVLQSDGGNFQIENPNGAEVAASTGPMRLERLENSELSQTVRLSGEFPALPFLGDSDFLRYSAEFSLLSDRSEVRLQLGLDWRGEAARVRLCLPTELNCGDGIYEIPFGVVRRKPYSPRTNAKGEWPAHRFVALEGDGHGLALVNTGVAGVEVNGGTLHTTLLRAPASVYAGMTLDDSSSQHGHHDYQFSLLPYAGSWADAGVAKLAQELNNPLLSANFGGESVSFGALKPENVILSSIKAATDESGALIVRVYETAGRSTDAVLTLPDASQFWASDPRENALNPLESVGGTLHFSIQPFEIKTFRIARKKLEF